MTYSVIVHTTKPADKAWWGPANATKSAAIRAVTHATAGLISSTGAQSPADANVWVVHQLWDSKASYDAYAAGLATNTYYQERNAYGAANGFVTTRHMEEITLA